SSSYGIDVQTVSMKGFTHKRCRRICSCESTRVQQQSLDFNEQPTTGSTTISYEQQNSTNINTVWNLVRDQGVGGSNPLSPANYHQRKSCSCRSRAQNSVVLRRRVCQRCA